MRKFRFNAEQALGKMGIDPDSDVSLTTKRIRERNTKRDIAENSRQIRNEVKKESKQQRQQRKEAEKLAKAEEGKFNGFASSADVKREYSDIVAPLLEEEWNISDKIDSIRKRYNEIKERFFIQLKALEDNETKSLEEKRKTIQDKIVSINEQQRNRLNQGFVYVIQGTDDNTLYKIGKSFNPNSRKEALSSQYQSDMMIVETVLCDDYGECERVFHRIFKDCRHAGEWFYLKQEDLQWFSYIAETYKVANPKIIMKEAEKRNL